MHLLTSLLVLLVFARVLGQTFKRLFGQPEVVGEILAGVILGPALLGWVAPNQELAGISQLAVFLIIFYAGLELDIEEVFNAFMGPGLPIAILGFAAPLFSGIGIGYVFDLSLYQSSILGLCLAITALPVAIRLLGSFKLLDTELGHNALGAAIVIDIVALLALGIILDAPGSKNIGSILGALGSNLGKMAGFFGIILLTNWIIVKKLKKNIFHDTMAQFKQKFGVEALFGLAVLFVLIFSAITEAMGFHFVIGAFFGGMLLSREFIGEDLFQDVQTTLNSISSGFLSPLFFAFIGLQFTSEAFASPLLMFSILIMGMASKTFGAYLGGRIAGVKSGECLAVGVILNGRGVMDLVVAEIALTRGVLSQGIFSCLVLLSIISTFASSISYKWVNRKFKVGGPEPGGEALLGGAESGPRG